MNIRVLVIVLIMIFLSGTGLIAQSIDKPLATVRLIKQEVISLKQFKDKVELLEQQLKTPIGVADRKKLLEGLIDEKLILQAAERDNINVTDSEINNHLALYKNNIAMQLGRNITDSELRMIVEQQGQSWDYFYRELGKEALLKKYIMQKQRSYFEDREKPTREQIQDYYESNKTKFVSPEMVRFKQIFIDTRSLSSNDLKTKAKSKADQILRELKQGASMDDYWEVYIETGEQTKVGGLTISILRRDDDRTKGLFGKEYFDAIFKLKKDELSGVITSNVGYHIVYIVEKIPFKILELDDKVPPQNASTVKEYIELILDQTEQAKIFQKALEDLIAELEKQADIKIFEENLSW